MLRELLIGSPLIFIHVGMYHLPYLEFYLWASKHYRDQKFMGGKVSRESANEFSIARNQFFER